jgi:hypothetical protein
LLPARKRTKQKVWSWEEVSPPWKCNSFYELSLSLALHQRKQEAAGHGGAKAKPEGEAEEAAEGGAAAAGDHAAAVNQETESADKEERASKEEEAPAAKDAPPKPVQRASKADIEASKQKRSRVGLTTIGDDEEA